MAKKPRIPNLLDDVAERVTQTQGIRAYHGSPHDFDRFDLSKIGTGEGAQAYGHGLYFAENEGIAKSYRDTLAGANNQFLDSGRGKGVVIENPIGDGWRAAMYQGEPGFKNQTGLPTRGLDNEFFQTFDEALTHARKQGYIKHDNPALTHWDDGYHRPIDGTGIANLEDLTGAQIVARDPGRMYEVNIRANPEDFLDWDKPLALQPAAVQELARTADLSALNPGVKSRVLVEKFRAGNEQPEYPALGHHLHNVLEDYGRQPKPELSQYLLSQGIPGVKYLDAGSRAIGDGSRNYVVFDDKLIDIIRKYGIVPGGFLGAAAMAPSDANAAPSRPDWIGNDGAITGNPPWLRPDPNERSTLGKVYDAVSTDPVGTFKAFGGALSDAVKGYIGEVRQDPGKGAADALELGVTALGGAIPQAFWMAGSPDAANAGEDAILADRRRQMRSLLAD